MACFEHDLSLRRKNALMLARKSRRGAVQRASGTSREVIERLGAAVNAVLSDQQLRHKILNAGIEPAFSQTPQEFAGFVRA
jgi:tripartite-type tricarboxylate transporter receptor subunit TctC